MDMYNADGSRGEMCGNGIRCVGKYVYDCGLTDREEITVETLAGIRYLKLLVEEKKVAKVQVNMGEPVLDPETDPRESGRGYGGRRTDPGLRERVEDDLRLHGKSPCGGLCRYAGEGISAAGDRAVF